MATTFQPTTASAAVEGLPQVFDAGAAAGLEAVVSIDLSGREPGLWTVVIREGTCRVMPGRTIEPTVTVSGDSDVWLAVARGEKRSQDVVANGEIHCAGDLEFVRRFPQIFPVE